MIAAEVAKMSTDEIAKLCTEPEECEARPRVLPGLYDAGMEFHLLRHADEGWKGVVRWDASGDRMQVDVGAIEALIPDAELKALEATLGRILMLARAKAKEEA